MKSYRFTIIYSIVICALNVFHYQVSKMLSRTVTGNFAVYSIYAVFTAFFLVVLFKVLAVKKNNDVAVILLTAGLMGFFLFSQPMLIFKLTLLELFLLGVLTAWEGRKAKNFLPFVLILGTAVLVEFASNFSIGSHFYYMDALRNSITALSGYLAGTLLN